MSVSTHNDFSGGMMKDPQLGQLPENAVADALDVFFDIPAKIRRRGRTTGPTASTITASVMSIGMTGSAPNGAGPYGVTTNGGLGILETGVFTSLSSAFGAPEIFGRPTQFFGIGLFPMYASGSQSYIPAVARADGSGHNTYNPPAATVATVTAGSSIVTFSAGDFSANTQGGGQFVIITDSASSSTRNIYLGTFEVLSSTSIAVDPVPTKSFTATQGTGVGTFVNSVLAAFTQAANPNAVYAFGARCIGVHQNRVLLGGASRFNTSTSQVEDFPRSVFYTTLPTGEAPSGNVNAQGHSWFFREAVEANNRFDIGGSEPIRALAPVDDNEVLILTGSTAWRLTGYLSTRTTNDAGGITYDVHPDSRAPGILSERALQRSAQGYIWAAQDDLYLYERGSFQPLLGRANSRYYRSLLETRVVLGSHLPAQDMYVISLGKDTLVDANKTGATVTLAFHIPTRTLSRLSGNTLVLFSSVTNPVNPNQQIGLRWWDLGLAAPSMAGGQVVYTDSVTKTDQATGPDLDGNAIAPIVTTRVYDEGSPDQKKRFWRTLWRVVGSSTSVSVFRGEDLYGAASSTLLAGPLGVSGLSSFTGPVFHTVGPQYQITTGAPNGPFEVHGFDHYYDVLPYAVAS